MNLKIPFRGPRAPRELAVKLSGQSLQLPDTQLVVPSRLHIEHTVTRTPPPRPHALTAVVHDPRGYRYQGNPTYIRGTESQMRLNLPQGWVFAKSVETGEYYPIYDLDVEVWWQT